MDAKLVKNVLHTIEMFTAGAAVGCAVNGQWAAAGGLALVVWFAMHCWGIVDELERD